MKTTEAFRFSAKTIRSHIKRSIIVAVVMGIIFGLIFTINLLLQGLMNSYTKLAIEKSNNQTIILATNESNSTISREHMVDDIENHGGKVIGDMEVTGEYGAIVLPKYLVDQYIEASIEKLPKGIIPILVPTFIGEQLLDDKLLVTYKTAAEKLKAYEKYRKDIVGKTFENHNGEKYYVAGLPFGGFQTHSLSFSQLEKGNYNILNPILEAINIQPGTPIAIDNGKIENRDKIAASSDLIIAVFDNNESIYEYFENSKAQFPNTSFHGREYSVSIISGMSPETSYMFGLIKLITNIVSIVLGCIAIMIVVFTSIRLVDQDKQNISLYRSLGASSKQISVIYLCYFVEIILGALIFAFGIALILVILFNMLNQSLIDTQAMLALNLPIMPKVIWLGINLETIVIAIVMFALAPLCTFVNRNHFK